jgi:transcription initiation factor TFIIB
MKITVKSRKSKSHHHQFYERENCCNNPSYAIKDGQMVCINCGMVSGQCFVAHERRAYSELEVNNRRHNEPAWREFGPRTVLSTNNCDFQGKTLNAKSRTLMVRLIKIQRSLVNSLERNFWEAKPKLKNLAYKIGIPAYVQETAWRIYCEVAKKRLTMGRSIDGFVSASLYAAIRVHGYPKLLEEVCECSMIPQHTFFRSLGMIIRDILPILNYHYQPISEDQLIFLIGNKLGFPMGVQLEALKIMNLAFKDNSLTIGKDPKGVAASTLYVAAKKCHMNKTQTEIANAAKITEVTLRSRLNDIKNFVSY